MELLTVNSAWFYTSIFALVGLFVGYAGMQTGERFEDWSAMWTLLVGRWLLVAGAVAVAFLVLFPIVAILSYDPFSMAGFAAVGILTAAVVMAFVERRCGHSTRGQKQRWGYLGVARRLFRPRLSLGYDHRPDARGAPVRR
ncbi:MAG: hypothetical protein U5K37_10215 [Natrialbaceae archaeon]|nr:hypothetical protein [Natrialbaceae archaeon]